MKKSKVLHTQNLENKDYGDLNGLSELEENLPRYNKSIVRKFSKYFGIKSNVSAQDFSILDFGAGIGSLAEVFKYNYHAPPICLEIDPLMIKTLRKKGFTVLSDIRVSQKKFRYVYTSNVLEHIENDLEALINLRKSMAPNGKIGIYVPAFPILSSKLDQQAGHYRRYTRRSLKKLVALAGFQIERCFYSDCLGFPATIGLKILKIRGSSGLPSSRWLATYDRLIHPISSFLDSLGVKFLFGKNIYLFAKIADSSTIST